MERERPGLLNRAEAKAWYDRCNMSGWHILIDDLYDRLPDGVAVVSVHQKYAIFCATLTEQNLELAALLNELAERSASICERCGAAGQWCIDAAEWEAVLCEAHCQEAGAQFEEELNE